jgi:hypothetical protein
VVSSYRTPIDETLSLEFLCPKQMFALTLERATVWLRLWARDAVGLLGRESAEGVPPSK